MVEDFTTILTESLLLQIPAELKDKLIQQFQKNILLISHNICLLLNKFTN